MVEGQKKEGVLKGVHPVLPSLALAFKRMVATIERESGVGGMKWFLLTVLGRRDGLSQGEFTQEYEMDPSRVTRTAQSLEGDGLIRRERDVEDNRVMRMYLTEEGRELLRRLPEIDEQSGRRETVLAVAGLMLALFLVALDQTVVGTALPKIIADLNGFEHYAWVTTAYLPASTAMIPVIGKLGDIYGRKWFIISGGAIFLAASALCGAAWGMTELILFRGLQGLGAGMIFSNIFTSVADIFPDPARRAKYQGVFFSVFALTSVIGFVVAGILFAAFIPVELKATEPVIPLSLFKSRVFSSAALLMFMVGIAMFGVILYTPLFVQGVLGKTATGAGTVLTPLVLSMTAMGVICGQIIARIKRIKPFMFAGSIVMTIGIYLLTTLDVDSTQ